MLSRRLVSRGARVGGEPQVVSSETFVDFNGKSWTITFTKENPERWWETDGKWSGYSTGYSPNGVFVRDTKQSVMDAIQQFALANKPKPVLSLMNVSSLLSPTAPKQEMVAITDSSISLSTSPVQQTPVQQTPVQQTATTPATTESGDSKTLLMVGGAAALLLLLLFKR